MAIRRHDAEEVYVGITTQHFLGPCEVATFPRLQTPTIFVRCVHQLLSQQHRGLFIRWVAVKLLVVVNRPASLKNKGCSCRGVIVISRGFVNRRQLHGRIETYKVSQTCPQKREILLLISHLSLSLGLISLAVGMINWYSKIRMCYSSCGRTGDLLSLRMS